VAGIGEQFPGKEQRRVGAAAEELLACHGRDLLAVLLGVLASCGVERPDEEGSAECEPSKAAPSALRLRCRLVRLDGRLCRSAKLR